MPRESRDAQDREAVNRSSEPRSSSAPTSERIAQRAYERYEARGREDGHDLEDWFEAEREFEQPSSGSTRAGEATNPDSTE